MHIINVGYKYGFTPIFNISCLFFPKSPHRSMPTHVQSILDPLYLKMLNANDALRMLKVQDF